MKYLCLIYVDEKRVDALPEQEIDAVIGECVTYDDSLRKAGRLLASERLQPVSTATSIRHIDGEATITDGPFAETKEQLGGFYLIEAPDLDEAVKIARDMPPGRLGTVEVRPIMEYAQS